MNLRIRTLAAVGFTGLALTACGKVGELERPGPLFGQERNTTKDADNAERNAQDPSRPVDTVDPRDRTTDPAPPRTLPIEGTAPNPTGSAPPTAMPNPYSNPRR